MSKGLANKFKVNEWNVVIITENMAILSAQYKTTNNERIEQGHWSFI